MRSTTGKTYKVVVWAAPFTGLNDPWGVAVDSGGSVYVTDNGNNRVLKLPVQ